MKKTLVAMAVLAASGAAMAQSSVTLYGVLDIGVSKLKGARWGLNNGDAGYGGTPDGFHAPSRIGFRGTEDLGGGLKANFNLETNGIDLSTGSTTVAFGREAWAGLEGGFGAVQLGRSSSIAAKVMGMYDLNATSYSSALDKAGLSAVTWYGSSRRSSQIQYASPNFGGLVVRAGFTPKGDEAGVQGVGTAAAFANAKNRYSLGATFANGPLAVSAVAETKQAETAINGQAMRTAYAVGASYDLKVVKIAATYNRRETPGGGAIYSNYNTFSNGANFSGVANGGTLVGGKGWTVGVVAPIGGLVNVGVQYARNTTSDIEALELWANYALSKRTSVYVDYVRGYSMNAQTGAAVAGITRAAAPGNPNAVGVGVLHTF